MRNFSVTTALVTLVALYGFGANAFAADPVSDKPATVAVRPTEAAKPSAGVKKVKTGNAKVVERKPQAGQAAVGGVVECAKATYEKHMTSRGPRISVNGIVDSRYSFRSDKKAYDVPQGSKYDADSMSMGGNQYDYLKNWGFQTDAVLNIRAENRNMHLGGISYGADVQVGLSATKSSIFSSDGAYSRGASVFIGHQWGTLSGGYQDGTEVLMRVDASNVAAGKVGSDSNWYKSVNLEGADGSMPFYLQSSLYSESLFKGAIYNIQGGSPAKKLYLKDDFFNSLPFRLSYYSPNFMGLKLGVSYSPYYKDGLFELNGSNSAPSAGVRGVKAQRAYAKLDGYKTVNVQAGRLELIGSAATNIKDGVQVTGATVDIAALPISGTTTAQSGVVVADSKLDIPALPVSGTTTANNGVAVAGATVNIPSLGVELKNVGVTGSTTPMYDSSTVDRIIVAGQNVAKGIDADVTELGTRLASVEDVLGIDSMPLVAEKVSFIGPKYENIFSGGISYEYDAKDWKFKVSATGEAGAAAPVSDLRLGSYTGYTLFNDLQAFNLGAKVEYKGFKAAASYANLNKSGVLLEKYIWDEHGKSYVADKDNGNLPQNSTYYWTLGAGYQYEETYFSATYFYSDKDDGNVLKDFALGVQCDLALGSKAQFTPYATWHYFTTKTTAAVPNNEGSVVLIGVKFSF